MIRPSILVVLSLGLAPAATLEKLSLSEMTDKATTVVRAKVDTCSASLRGSLVYTTCSLAILERWKGHAATVSTPGGIFKGVRQVIPGAPDLKPGMEAVFFLWTGPSGTTHLMGLSQGLVKIGTSPAGQAMAYRAPIADRMLNAAGIPVPDNGFAMPLEELRTSVAHRVSK